MKAVLNVSIGEILALIEYHDKMYNLALTREYYKTNNPHKAKEHRERIEELTRIKDEFWPK